MNIRHTTIRGAVVLFVLGLGAYACSRGGKRAASGAGGGAAATVGSADCYKTAGAAPCPPDPSDPSGRKLPTPGGLCTLAPCKACGSATVPSYRDSTGAPQVGWCICVPRSDDSGISIYTCRGPAEWPRAR